MNRYNIIKKHLPTAERKSTCKRINMYLRYFERKIEAWRFTGARIKAGKGSKVASTASQTLLLICLSL
jgi:hypothetical protein